MREGLLVLLGVLVGGFLNYWVQLGIERRRRQVQARTAARLIVAELFTAQARFQLLKSDGTWETWALGSDFMPVSLQRWHEWAADLAGTSSWDAFITTNSAVIGFQSFERLWESVDLTTRSNALTDAEKAEVDRRLESIAAASDSLGPFAGDRASPTLWWRAGHLLHGIDRRLIRKGGRDDAS